MWWVNLLDFLEKGGAVLYTIFFVMIIAWMFILERYFYLFFYFPKEESVIQEKWGLIPQHQNWEAHSLRKLILSQTTLKLEHGLMYIKIFITICPLLGLLGTVMGMIEVFDVMAITGTGNARAMASGISKATIPTMAGMIAALSCIYFHAKLCHLVQIKIELLADHLT